MLKRLLILLTIPWLLMAPSADQYDTNAKIKSIYIYNFTKYIEWPEDYKSGNFVIGILGESNLHDGLQAMATSKKVANQAFEIKRFNSVGEIDKCHMLIIPRKMGAELTSAKSKVTNYATLIITEEEGLALKGSGINFVVKENKQKFELNKSNIENHNLQISSSLLSLALVVGP